MFYTASENCCPEYPQEKERKRKRSENFFLLYIYYWKYCLKTSQFYAVPFPWKKVIQRFIHNLWIKGGRMWDKSITVLWKKWKTLSKEANSFRFSKSFYSITKVIHNRKSETFPIQHEKWRIFTKMNSKKIQFQQIFFHQKGHYFYDFLIRY